MSATGDTEADIKYFVEHKYQSKVLIEEQRERFGPRLRELVLAMQPSSIVDARAALGTAVVFLAGVDIGDSTVDDLLTDANVASWTAGLLRQGTPIGTVENHIGRLERLLRAKRELPGRIRVQESNATPVQGYTDDEMATLKAAAVAASVHAVRGFAASIGLGRLDVESGTFTNMDGCWWLVHRNGTRERVLPLVAELADAWGDGRVRDGDVDAFRVVARDLGMNVDRHLVGHTFRRCAFELRMPTPEVLSSFKIAASSIESVRHAWQPIDLSTPDVIEMLRGRADAACAPVSTAHVAPRPPSSGGTKDKRVTKKSKPSRNEAKRLAAEYAERIERPEPLSEALRLLLEDYEPLQLAPDEWAAVRPVFIEVMGRCSYIKGEAAFKRNRAALAGLLAWSHRQHRSLAIASVLSYQMIDAYWADGLDGMQETTRSDYRSRLRNIAERVNPSLESPVSASTGHRSVRPGYTEAEEAAIIRVVVRQRRSETRRKACVIVGLSGGGGLDALDLRHVYRHTILDRGEAGILVEVGGKRPRTVAIRRDYEQLVRIGIEGLEPNEHVLRYTGSDAANPVGRMLEDVERFHDTPHIDVSRLRSTWLCWLMSQPVPIRVVLQAAGLKSARTLTDLLPTVPTFEGDVEWLRDGSAK